MATYETIQARLNRKVRVSHVDRDLEYRLTQLVFCAYCGKGLTSSTVKGRTAYYPYYSCQNKHCTSPLKNIPRADLEKNNLECLRKSQPLPIVIDYIVDELRREFPDHKVFQDAKRTRLQAALATKEKELKVLVKRA